MSYQQNFYNLLIDLFPDPEKAAHFMNACGLDHIPESYAAAKNSRLYLNVNPNGNKKLVNSKKYRFIIWNLPPVKTCPNATTSCINLCYAKKAERIYKAVKAARARNYIDACRADFVARMVYTLLVELARPSNMDAETVQVRIHESGDFYDQKYFDAWQQITEYFTPVKKLVFMAYTKSVYFVHESRPDNFRLRFSLWADTPTADAERAAALKLPVYMADTVQGLKDRAAAGEVFHVCRCADCGTCAGCPSTVAAFNRIFCVIH